MRVAANDAVRERSRRNAANVDCAVEEPREDVLERVRTRHRNDAAGNRLDDEAASGCVTRARVAPPRRRR